MKRILEAFGGEEIRLDPALEGTVPDLRTEQSEVPSLVIASETKQSQYQFGAGSESGLSPMPVVLSKEEVAKIFSSVDNIKHKAILMLAYSAGLRVGEVVRLKPEDIDSN